MCFQRVRVDQYVIDVEYNPEIEHVPEHIIDVGLEDGWTVGEPERHNKVFIVPSGR